jgi:hypothetical protein
MSNESDQVIQWAQPLAVSELSATQATCDRRDKLLLSAMTITRVHDPVSAQAAGDTIKELKAFSRSIENARTTVKAPVLRLEKSIDELAANLTSEILAEEKRIGGLIGPYQANQQKLAQEAKQKAWAEEQRLLRVAREQQEEADRIARQQEADRQAQAQAVIDAANAKAARARTDAGRAKAEAEAAAVQLRANEQAAEAKRKADAAEESREKALTESIAATRSQVALATPGKIAGVSNRRNPKYEITDIRALYEAAPFMVNLTPNDAALKSAIKGLADGQTLPGVRHWFENSVAVR